MNFFDKASDFITRFDRIILKLDDSLWPRNWHQNVTMLLSGMLFGFAFTAFAAVTAFTVMAMIYLASA